MADILDGIIKQEDLDVSPQRVSFQELVGDARRHRGEKFIQFLPGGRLPEQPSERKEPEVSQEELHQRRLEAIERETYQKAFAAGEEAGLALGEQTMEREIARLLPQFESVLHQLDNLPKRIFASAERFLVETSLLMTRELLGHELTIDPTEITHRVQRVLNEMAGRRDIVLYLSPDNATLLQGVTALEKLRIEADPSVAPGSVRLESDFGGMEDNLEQQLAEMEAGLRRYLQDRLQASGCEDIAAWAQQSAERASEPRPILSPRSPSPPPPATPLSDQAQHSTPAKEDSMGSPSVSPIGMGEIADALAHDQGEEPLPHGAGYQADSPVEEDVDDMSETVVSISHTQHGHTQWGDEYAGVVVPARARDELAPAEPVPSDHEDA